MKYALAVLACAATFATLGAVLLRRLWTPKPDQPASFDWQNERPQP